MSLLSFALWLTVALSTTTAHASTIHRPGLDALLTRAGLVFEAEVLSVSAGYGAEGAPSTRVSVEVLDVLSGPAQKRGAFWFELPEGRMADGRLVMLAGAPRFAPGHRYLVFYRSGRWHHTPVVGWSHGVLRRVRLGQAAVWVDAHGRCIAGLEKSGWLLGPRVAGAAPVPAGWISAGADGRDENREGPPPTATACLSAEDVGRALKRRVLELDPPRGPIERQPTRGGWVEAGAEP